MLKKINRKAKVLKSYIIFMNLFCLAIITSSFADLKLHIPLDMNCNDISGNNNDGYFYGDANWENGVCESFNQGLFFNEQGDYIQIEDFHYKSCSNEFTLSFWFNVEDNSGYYYKYVFSHGYVGYNNSLNIYFYENGKSDAPLLRTYLRDCNGLPGMTALDITSDFCDGSWHLYTLTVSQNDIRVYIDGTIRASANSGGGYFNPYTNIFVGGRNDLNYYRMYGGLLDDIRIYDSKMSPEEVYEITGSCEAGGSAGSLTEVWNVSKFYEKGSIVIHEGYRYFALQPVSAGISTSNSDYWQIFYSPEHTLQTPSTHEHIARKLVDHSSIQTVAGLNGISYGKLKEYAKNADDLDFDKNELEEKYVNYQEDFNLQGKYIGPEWKKYGYYHSAWGACFEGKKYRTDPRWQGLSEDRRMAYLLHNIGDATVPVGHGIGGKIYQSSYQESFFEFYCAHEINGTSDLPAITPYEGTIDQALSQYKIDQTRTATWFMCQIPKTDNVRANAGWGRDDPPYIRGSLENGLSLGFAVLLDYYISKIRASVTIGGPSVVQNGESATLTATASLYEWQKVQPALMGFKAFPTPDPNDHFLFEWDTDNDGEFDDITGRTITIPYNDLVNNSNIIRVRTSYEGYSFDTDAKYIRLDEFDPIAKGRFEGSCMEEGLANVLAGPINQHENEYLTGVLRGLSYVSLVDPFYNFDGSYDPDGSPITGKWDLDNDDDYEKNNINASLHFDELINLGVKPYEKHTVTLTVTDEFGHSTSKPDIELPILIPPEFSDYTVIPAIFHPKDQIVRIDVTTFDRDNYGGITPEPNGGIISIKWDLNGDNLFADILDYNAMGSSMDYTYRELINAGLKPGTNSIRARILDDDVKLSWSENSGKIISEIPVTLASPEIGDANCDGFINQADKDILQANLGQSTNTGSWHDYWLKGDFNQDGIVNATDISLLEGQWEIEFDFTAERVEGNIPFTASFAANSIGAPVDTWDWDFGDGINAATEEPHTTHTYTQEGVYTVKLVATGQTGTKNQEKVDYITVKPAVTYCGSQASSCYYEWIAGVQAGNINNSSGAAGYTDFTSQTIELAKGGSQTITLTPGFPAGHGYSEWWKVWIDYTQDGDFEDEGELVFKPDESSQPVTGEFTVPVNTFIGKTRMRVQMMFNFIDYDDPCAYFDYGEVEDYSVFIVNSAPKARFTFNEQECVDGGCTNVGSPAYVADQTGGQALRCDGQSYIAYPDAPEYQMGTVDLSISCWVRTGNYCWPPKSVLDKRYFPTGIGYHLCVVRNCEVLIQLADNTGWSNYNRNSCVTLTDNQWHHIVVTVDRDKPDGIHYYVDGVLRANGNPMDRQGSLDNPNDLLLGGQNDTQDAYFTGDIDNVRLYDKVISEDLISNLYNSKL